MVLVVLTKVFPHKLDEQLANIFFHILALWWVEPYNLSVSTSSLLLLKDIDEKSPQSFSTVSQTSLLQFPYYRISLNISSGLF